MNLSLTEFASLCRTAARGAGFSWGQAGDVGMACRWLAAHDLWPEGSVDTLFSVHANSPFLAGMAIADAGVCGDPIQVSHPEAVLPFVALLDQSYVMNWAPSTDVVLAEFTTGTPEFGSLQTRAIIPETDILALKELAFKTYAPATEESRRLGAG